MNIESYLNTEQFKTRQELVKETNIALMMKKTNISKAELVERSGIPKRTIESWLRRERIPRDVYVLNRIAEVLGCPIEKLLDDDEVEAQKAGLQK